MRAQEPDDQALIGGCLRGDAGSWDVFVRRFAGLVRWAILRALSSSVLAGDEQAAAEIFQDVFKGLLEKRRLESLQRAERIRKYLCVLSAHATVDHLRRVVRERRLGSPWPSVPGDQEADASRQDFPDIPDDQRGPDEETQASEFRVILDELLDELPGRERACFEWHYLEGRTHESIARALGIPRDTVSTVIRRTRESLRTRLIERGVHFD